MLKYDNWINLYQEIDTLKKEEISAALFELDNQLSKNRKLGSDFFFLRMKLALLKRKLHLEKEEALSLTTYSFQIDNKNN